MQKCCTNIKGGLTHFFGTIVKKSNFHKNGWTRKNLLSFKKIIQLFYRETGKSLILMKYDDLWIYILYYI